MGEFEGTFCPPMLSTSVPPIRVTGKGSCEVGEEGLTVHGHMATGQGEGRGRDLLQLLGVALLIVGGIMLVVIVKLVVAPRANVFLVVIPLGAIGGAVYRAVSRGGTLQLGDWKPPATRVSRTIPWADVGEMHLAPDAPGTLVIPVRDFGGAAGALHFRPAPSVAPFLAALRQHGAYND